MARDAQSVVVGEEAGTLVDIVPLQRNPSSAWAPFQLVSFRGSFLLDGSGVGDTADCRIRMPLPGNNVYQMQFFHMTVDTTTAYDLGQFELYYAPKPGEFGSADQCTYQLQRTTSWDVWNSGTVNVGYFLSPDVAGGAGSLSIGQVEQSPFRPIYGGTAVGGTDPAIHIGSGADTNAGTGTCRFVVNFLGYTLEQWQHSALYAGLASR